MPELPEVEATVRYLRERVEGETIRSVTVGWYRTIHTTCTPSDFKARLEGARFEELFRRGKFVGMRLSGVAPQYLFTHLRMSGSFDVVAATSPEGKHDRVVFTLDNGRTVRFNDPRKFGRMYLGDSSNIIDGKVGIEPLSDDFTADTLISILRMKRGRIKSVLLDQSLVAGLGNIYVDECLWKAKVHPAVPASSVSRPKVQLLFTAIRETLSEAIALAGTDFGDGVVEGGMYAPSVYGRDEKPCTRCGTLIKRIVVGQRGTHICPRCQRK